MKTNTIIVLGCLLFVLALAAIGAEAARGDYEDRRGGGGRGGDNGGGGRSGGGRGGYEEEEQDFGRGGSHYPARIEPEVTKVVKKCPENNLKIKFQWDFFIFLPHLPRAWSPIGLAQASMAA